MSKIMKCAANEDSITIKAGDNADNVTFMFESPSELAGFDAISIEYTMICLTLSTVRLPDAVYTNNLK